MGRTTRAQNGLRQRLFGHLNGRSSFTRVFFARDGSQLRAGYRYKVLVVSDPRIRALLEAYAVGRLCPQHLGLGLKIVEPVPRKDA